MRDPLRWLTPTSLAVLAASCSIPTIPEAELFTPDGEPDRTCPADPGVQGNAIESDVRETDAAVAALQAELLDPDRITVVQCGTGSPVPTRRAQTCTAVFVGGRFFVFDTGDRSQSSIEALNLPVKELDGIFITHFHSDHIADLGEAISRSWILGRTAPLTVYGPEGIAPIVDAFLTVYAADIQYRIDHHGVEVFPEPTLRTTATTIQHTPEGVVAYEQDGIVVRAFTVEHEPIHPSLGYRIEYRGKVIGITGDTVDTPGLRGLADKADVLVSEVLEHGFTRDWSCALDRAGNPRSATIIHDIREYHIGPETLGRLAEAQGVRTLMLTHLVPSQEPDASRQRFTPPIRNGGFTGELVVGEDGSTVVVASPQ